MEIIGQNQCFTLISQNSMCEKKKNVFYKKNPKTVDETEAPLNNQNTPIMYYLPFEQPKSYYITQA